MINIGQLIDAYTLPSDADWSSLYKVVAEGGAMGCLQTYSQWAQASGNYGLAVALSTDCVRLLDRAELWSPFFSRQFALSTAGIPYPCDNALHLALFLAGKGVRTSVAAQFTAPTPVLLSGQVFTCVNGFCTDGGKRISLFGTQQETIELEISVAESGSMSQTAYGHGSAIPRVGPFALLDARSLPHSWRMLLPFDRCGLEIQDGLTQVQLLEDASAILLSAPHYYEWVTRMIGWIVPVRSSGGRLLSGSVSSLPGLVYASYDCHPLMLAESLVHEASHQCFYQLNSIEPLYLRDSPWTGWSPFMRRARTVDGLLLGCHAFVNVAGFYLSLSRLGLHVDESARQMHQTNALLDECMGSLRDCPSLTKAGQDFVTQLAAARDVRASAT